MSIKFNVFTSNFDFDTTGSTTWLQPVANRSLLPSGDPDGAARVVTDEDVVFVYDNGADEWHNTRLSLTQFNAAANAAGVTLDTVTTLGIVDYRINLHAADSTNPGGVSTTSQNFAGDKTFDNNVIVTGDLTVNGTQTILNTATVDVEDTNITINKNGTDITSEGSGLTIERAGVDGSFIYEDALTSKFKLGALGSEIEVTDISSSQILTNKTVDGTSATGTNVVTTDADQVTYERADLSKKNIDAASDEVESAISDLDDAIGALNTTPTEYTPTDASIVADHLDASDTEIGPKADRDLNNVTTPSINQSLLPDLDSSKDLGSSTLAFKTLHLKDSAIPLSIKDENNNVVLEVSTNKNPPSGFIGNGAIITPDALTPLAIVTKNAGGTDNSESLYFETGVQFGTAGNTGNVNINTGSSNTSGNSGDVSIKTGTVTSGTRGDISLDGEKVDVNTSKIVNVVDPTADQDVATKKYVDTGLSTKADTDLNNLIATSVNQSLVPDLNNSKNLGTSSKQWNLIYGKFFMSKTSAPYFGSDFNSGFGVDFLSGHSNTANNTGSVTLQTGDQLSVGSGTVGTLNLESGEIFEATNPNITGVINIKSGDTVGGGFTGAVNILSGNAAATGSGRSGAIVIQTGTAVGSGVRGSIVFDARNTIFNNRAYPNIANTIELGQASRSWSRVYANIFEGRVGTATFTSGVDLGIDTLLSSGDSSTATISADVNIQSGRNTSTGNSGNVNIETGTVGAGTRGVVTLDSDVDKVKLATQPTGADDLAVATTKYVDDNTSFVIGDLDEVSFGVANNQAVFANVTGVAFNNANTRSAEIEYSILIDATSDLYESGKIMAIQRGADWVISQSTNGDISQILFDITPSGQLQYKSANYAGFVSGLIKCRAITTSV